MADNVQKIPLARSLEQFANRKIAGAMTLYGMSLPASIVSIVSAGIVTVKFELTNIPYTLPNVTVPVVGCEFGRPPYQVGTLGRVVPTDAYLGGISGLGGGTADLSRRGNLSNLAWEPIGSVNWSASDDPNAYVLYGPDGVILRTSDSTCKVVVSKTGVDLYPPPGLPVTVHGNLVVTGNISGANLELSGAIQGPGAATYTGNIHTTGTVTGDTDVVAAGISGAMHTHSGVTTGSGDSGPPV